MKYYNILILSVLCTVLLHAVQESAANLKSDLREFVALIPRRRIGYIAARHLILDQRFRVAIDYMRSEEFPETYQRIRNANETLEIIHYVTRNVNSTAANDVTSFIDRIPNQARKFQIPAKIPVSMMLERSLTTFLRDVQRTLPRGRITNLMARKIKDDGEFAKFYKSVRQPEFRQMINEARNSTNLKEPIQKLKKYSIDVDDIIEFGFGILKWGP